MVKIDRTHTLGEGPGEGSDHLPRPSLSLVLRADDPLAQPRHYDLVDVNQVLIGRGSSFEVETNEDERGRTLALRIPDKHLSTRHLRVWNVLDEWFVEDAGSKNGTLVNGAPCARAPLADGDVIEAGCAFFLFEYVPPLPEAAPASSPALATLCPAVASLHSDLARVADSMLSVLLLGESGVGKEVAAHAVHDLSRRTGPFVAVNCGVLADGRVDAALFGHRRGAFTGAIESRPGLVRSAEGGTLFLDEVGELPATAQVSLLRVLQEREIVPIGEHRAVKVDVRFVSATNRDLDAAVAAGTFRQDLLARLSGLTVHLPPLRARRADLGLLVAALLRRIAPDARSVRFTARAARALLRHDWPLNVRELEMCLASAGQLAGWGEVDLSHLPKLLREPKEPVDEAEARRAELTELLKAHAGNVAAVARALKTSRMQVHRLLKRFGLDSESFRK
jgi:Sigma-54 interaction domain/FHA domain